MGCSAGSVLSRNPVRILQIFAPFNIVAGAFEHLIVDLMKRRTDHLIVVLTSVLGWKNSAPNSEVEWPPGGHKDTDCCWSSFGPRR